MKRKAIYLSFLTVALASMIGGCSSMKPEDFRNSAPKLVLEEYFAGKTRAWGVVHDRSGDLVRQFTVDLMGVWDGQELKLTEDFVYSDGEKQQRIWYVRKIDEHNYEGRADDVFGKSIGVQYGQALYWSYDLNLKVKDAQHRVHFEDWMYLQPDNVLVNRAVMSKFGLEVGEVVLFFRKDKE